MAKVFLMNYSGHMVSDAQQYGSVIPLTEGNISLFDVDRLSWTLLKGLDDHKYNPFEDYIISSGSPIIGFIMGVVISSILRRPEFKKVNYLKLLIWDAKRRKYELREWYFKTRKEIPV